MTRAKHRFVEGNLELALSEPPRSGATHKLTDKEEALLLATTGSKTPGRTRLLVPGIAVRWNGVQLTEHQNLLRDQVRQRLGGSELKPW